jgi:adenosine deaminase
MKTCPQSLSEVEIFQHIPKLDLHAHLHGSIRRSTLQEFLGQENLELPSCKADLHGCFKIFQIIHQAINRVDKVTRITKEVLTDFMADGVVYTEIRTTPRPLPDGTSKLSYLKTVIAVFDEHNRHHSDKMIARLIVSLDRGSDVKEAENTLDVVEELYKTNKVIVAVDFSGNPHKGSFVEFQHVLERARSLGLRVTVHAGEIPGL